MDSIVLEQPSSSSGTACSGGGGSRAIDRHNPIIRDEKRLGQGFVLPSGSSTTTSTTITDQSRLCNPKPEAGGGDEKRKSVAFGNDDEFVQASGFISPASSSRCLLSDRAMSYFSPEVHHVPPPSPPPPPPPPRNENLDFRNEKAFKKKDGDLSSSPPPTPQPPQPPQPPPSSPPLTCDGLEPPQSTPHEPSSATDKPLSPPYRPPSSNQVVVLEVALHCRGCERKMKKHISKIEGVTSFKIEFAAKKVTVVGDVTPLAVLTSVLKVKNAKLLTPATISSSSSSSDQLKSVPAVLDISSSAKTD